MRVAPTDTQRCRFRAMGTAVSAITCGANSGLADLARAEIERLEGLWSRFIPESEISRLNACAGRPGVVSEDTFVLVAAAKEGGRMTHGLFEPLVGGAMAALGYDRSFELLPDHCRIATRGSVGDARDIRLDGALSAVTLPRGMSFDPGGIGKGLAADLVAGVLRDAGARGACINVGGDVRIVGEPPDGTWTVDVICPGAPDAVARLRVEDAGIATSAVRGRVWAAGGRERAHVIDPRDPEAPVTAAWATVIAPEAWIAEVLSTAALLAPPEEAFELMAAHDAVAIVGGADGDVRASPDIGALIA